MNNLASKVHETIAVLEEKNPLHWHLAATSLTAMDTRGFEERLISVMLNGRYEEQREAAAYALAHSVARVTEVVKRAFVDVMKNRSEEPRLRAQAIEGLAYIHEHTDKRTKSYKKLVDELISGIEDNAVEVRFWSVFALGTLRAKTAIRALRRLARYDETICPGWWHVKDEAEDAINVVLGGEWPYRKRIDI